jgi:hypothetical protein
VGRKPTKRKLQSIPRAEQAVSLFLEKNKSNAPDRQGIALILPGTAAIERKQKARKSGGEHVWKSQYRPFS